MSIPSKEYRAVSYVVEYTDEFAVWWETLNADEQESIDFVVRLLEEQGIHLKRPYAHTIHGAGMKNLRELRCQHYGRPYRILYAFDPRRAALLLIGGDKTERSDCYEIHIPRAERIYQQHLKELELQEEE